MKIFFVLFLFILISNIDIFCQSLFLENPKGGEIFDNKGQIAIKWNNEFESKIVLLEYSSDNGNKWNKIDTSSGSLYMWSIPNDLQSKNCLIRVSLYEEIYYFENKLVLQSHTNWINTISLGRGNNYLVSGGLDNSVKLWNKNDGKLLKTFEGHTNQVNSVCLSTDNKFIISGSSDSSIRVWNIETGENTLTLIGHKDIVRCVDISKDNKFVISSSNDSTLKIWNLISGELVKTLSGHEGWVIDVKSINSSNIVSGSSDKSVRIWNIETGENIKIFHGHNDNVNSICVSNDSKVIVSASSDNSIKLWDIDTGENFRTLLGHKFHVVGIDYNFDNSNLVSCSFDSTVKIWDVKTGENIKTFVGHNGWVRDVQYDFDGLQIFSCGFDSVIRRWDKRFLYFNTQSSVFSILNIVSSVFDNNFENNSMFSFQNNKLLLSINRYNDIELNIKVVDLNGVILSEYKNVSPNRIIDLSNFTGLKFIVVENKEELVFIQKCLIIK